MRGRTIEFLDEVIEGLFGAAFVAPWRKPELDFPPWGN